MPVIEVSRDDQYLMVTGETPLLDVYGALPQGLFPPFPPAELPGGVAGLVGRGGFGQTFFFAAEVLGATFRTPGGKRIKAGGRVVKNVQGYDLVRPLVGSFGQLGEIEDVTLRLRPGPASLHLVRAGRLADLTTPLPRFAWEEGGQLHAVHFGAPREVEALERVFGGERVVAPLDYRPLFARGMGTTERESVPPALRDGRFGWINGRAHPEVPALFRLLVGALS